MHAIVTHHDYDYDSPASANSQADHPGSMLSYALLGSSLCWALIGSLAWALA